MKAKHCGILRQSDASSVEVRLASMYGMTRDVAVYGTTWKELPTWLPQLRSDNLLPIGSVEFVRKAMELTGIEEPNNLSYPQELRPWLLRDVKMARAGSVLGNWFVKPVTTKLFTGFVFDTLSDPARLSAHDREQRNAFEAMPCRDLVWISPPVQWASEWRYYVLNGEIVGAGRYDDGRDEMPEPEISTVRAMVAAFSGATGRSSAYALDVGVLSSGETALVECNDAWALGYYEGTLAADSYIAMLWARWNQLKQWANCSAPSWEGVQGR